MVHGLVFAETRRLEMSSTGLMILHQQVSFLHGQTGSRIRYKRNVVTCMWPLTEWGSGTTRNAVCLTQKKVKPQLFFVRKCSRGPEATTCGQGYYTRRPLLFSVYMDVTSSCPRYFITLDKPGILFLSADILIFSLSLRFNLANEAAM